MSLVEWADKFRILSKESSSEPGPWRTSRVEVARGPMLAATDPRVKVLTVVSCTQLLKTELINNLVGYFAHLDPSPLIVMQPTEKIARAWSQDRLDKMVRDTPVLAEQFAAKRERDSSNTILHKSFAGGHITIVGANAPSDLASRPIRVVLCDEVDKYPASAGKEGDPIKLISERTATFWNSLKVHVCSPTIEGRSRIWSEYEQSDQRVFEVPCPHCKKVQELEWKQVVWTDNNPETAQYFCAHCGEAWTEAQRIKSISKGQWRATKPFKGHAGFRVSKLYSPWEPLSAIVEKFLNSKKEPEKLKVFVNTQLAETWKEKGDAPEWERLFDRRESYEKGQVQKGAYFLTAGVDVQEKRIEVEVVGWGKDKQSWSVQFYVFEGDTANESEGPWKKLDELLNDSWQDKDGHTHQIQVMAVDSGYRTQTVYNWVRKYPISRVIAVKGSDRQHVLMNTGTFVDVRKGTQRIRRGAKVFTLGVSLLKSELYGWLKLPTPIEGETYPGGFCHFPDYESEFFRQLTAESLVKRIVNGETHLSWEKIYERNEALDRRIYARAAASYFGIDRFKEQHWAALEKNLPQKMPQVTANLQPTIKIKRRKSEFL